MKKIDPIVIKETRYIAFFSIILSLLMQAVFLIIGKWDYTVVLGNILSLFFAVLNFLLMGITVQKAVLKDEKDAKNTMKVSQVYRNLLIVVVCVVGIAAPVFNNWSVIIPLFFPRVAIALRHLFGKVE